MGELDPEHPEGPLGLATRVDGSRRFRLADVDAADDGGLTEAEAGRRLRKLSDELRELQELLFGAETHGALVVLQGMDAAGKDVTIGTVFASATPEAIRVRHFKKMTEEEEAHDFFWRAHLAAPKHGELVIFDRSYYEQVVLPIVEGETDDDATRERTDDVRAFEAILRHGGTVIVKVFLHVSRDEQERRLVERMENLDTAWKVSANDWTARESWDDYMAAYEHVINATATPDEPWYVVPADREWFHNLAVAEALVERLRDYQKDWLAARRRLAKEKRAEAREVAPDGLSGGR